MTDQPTASAGKTLGRYRIERELGRGGMGVVYLAEDSHTGRQVALKTTSVANLGAEKSRDQRRQRFVREVQALAQLNHPNVVHVFDAGEADDPDLGWVLYYAMEYVDGETLAQLVKRTGPLDPGAAAAVVMQVASGLGAAHAAGVVHRDVKPVNIFISREGRALIGDFGICKIEGQTQITRRDQMVGTPNYLAPEQVLGEAVSPASDVFALGAIFYIITSNRALRSQTDAAALLRNAQGNEPKERMRAERRVPDALRELMARCLERDPQARISDGSTLAEALAGHATRIPPAGGSAGAEATSSSAPVATPSPDDNPGGGAFASPDDVEAAARAMLAEVSQRKPAKQATEEMTLDDFLEDGPLLEAKTESTEMFNMRSMEGQLGQDKAPAASPPATAAAFSPQPTLHVVRPTQRDAGAPEAPRGWAAMRARVTGIPRPARVGLSSVSGAVLGFAVALSTSQAGVAEVPEVVEAPVAVEALLNRSRPALCPASIDSYNASAADQNKAAEKLQEARRLEAEGGQAGDILALIEKARATNPRDPEVYFELARMLDKSGRAAEADQARDCVCFAARAHPKCEKVLKMRAPPAE